MKATRKTALLFATLALAAPLASGAQVNQSFSLIGPLFSIGGDVHVGDRSTEVDLSAEDVIDKLEIGGVLGYRAESEKWSFMAEGAFVGLGQTTHGLTMDLDMTVIEADAGYRLGERSEIFAGVRYTGLDVQIAGTRPVSGTAFDVKNDDDFFDPLVGFRFAAPLSDSGKWRVQGRGDIGGFGVSMDLTWQAILDFGYRPSDSWAIWLGYRALAQDFDDSGKDDRFAMNAIYQGPQVGISWMF